MTERNIKSAFRGAGLIPFNPESVVSKLDVQIRTPPPVEEIVPSTPWGSKTPTTVLEAEFQTEYLERRIRRHHSSSPEPILEALKSFAKGTKAIMHEYALVKQRSKTFDRQMRYLAGAEEQKGLNYRKEG